MARLTGAALGWLRRHLGRRRPGGGADTAVREHLQVGHALSLLESLACDGVVHQGSPGAPAREAAGGEIPRGGSAAINAFGRQVIEHEGGGPWGALALATGMSLAGLRTAAWLEGDELTAARDGLEDVAQRLTPLVVHVTDRGTAAVHAGCHAVAGVGLFQILPHDGQQAVDMSLVARVVSERALVGGLVVSAGEALEPLAVPSAELVRGALGRPEEELEAPTEAQRMVFGAARRRSFRWFDLDHPVATATLRGPEEAARAVRGRELYFWDHVSGIAADAMAAIAARTGRPLGFVSSHQLEDADVVFIATGWDVQTARAAADRLRAHRLRVGVLGVTWLRPWPAEAILAALGHGRRRAVVVIERVAGPVVGAPPLLATLRATLAGAGASWTSATGPVVRVIQLEALALAALDGQLPPHVRLDAVEPVSTGFPLRDAMLDRARGAYPRLADEPLPTAPESRATPGGLALAVAGHEAEVPPDGAGRIAEAVAAMLPGGSVIRGAVRRPEAGAWLMRVEARPADFASPGADALVDALVLLLDDPGDLGNPIGRVRRGGAVFIARDAAAEDVWDSLPPRWRAAIRARELRIYLVQSGLDAALGTVGDWYAGRDEALTVFDWRANAEPGPSERPVAPILRRIRSARPAHDSLPRFWGEVAGPRREGVVDGTPDPVSAAGAVPALASALEADPVGAPSLPSLDAAACTACGRCWSRCPDSALGATVIGIEPLLGAASRIAGTEGVDADAVRRHHKNLAQRIAGRLKASGAGALDEEALAEAWGWLVGKLELGEEARAAQGEAWARTAEVVARLAPVASERFFRTPEAQHKGGGELFLLAMDPRACQGCAICVAACADGALRAGARGAVEAEAARERWRMWEAVPDTRGKTIARAVADPQVGRLAGTMLSRHVALAQAGGGVSEPGSGERLAVRVTASLAEERSQRRVAELVVGLDEARERVEGALRGALTASLGAVGAERVRGVLAGLDGGRGALSELTAALDARGEGPTVDREALGRMAAVAGQLARHRERLAVGVDGLGRARFGLVFARGPLSEWAGRYPRHPYFAPMTVEPAGRGLELARGLIRGMMADHVAVIRVLRRAARVADPGPDVDERLAELERLRWEDLSTEERSGCPPLVFVGDETSIGDVGLGWLTRLLGSGLPIKVVMLDQRGRLEPAPEPALVAMAHRLAFVVATSIGAPDHLASGLRDALDFDGPAFIHVHAPSPRRLGFAPERTVEVARQAIEARVVVLFRYDPRLEGVFGQRATVAGNPAVGADFGEVDFVSWARGLARFAGHFEADGAGVPVPSAALRAAAGARLEVWRVLREVSGDASVFTEGIRRAVSREVVDAHARAIADLEAAHRSELRAARGAVEDDIAAKVTERLLDLAGYGRGGGP